jgi:hypothetical protein
MTGAGEFPTTGRTAAIACLDELVSYGVIDYTITYRAGKQPHVEVRKTRLFGRGLPDRASDAAQQMFRGLQSGEIQTLVNEMEGGTL